MIKTRRRYVKVTKGKPKRGFWQKVKAVLMLEIK